MVASCISMFLLSSGWFVSESYLKFHWESHCVTGLSGGLELNVCLHLANNQKTNMKSRSRSNTFVAVFASAPLQGIENIVKACHISLST